MMNFMRLKETLQKASRTTRLFHYRTYRRLGLWHLHKQIDISMALMLLLCVVSFPILMKCSFKKLPDELPSEVIDVESVSDEELTPITETEDVHEDLGDAPVENETHVSLSELEKRVEPLKNERDKALKKIDLIESLKSVE